jgi:HD superfamily phosphohydrolase
MRAIKQLSFCDWYFPGAGHSRFEHSLGTFGVAKLALEALVHDRTFRDVCTPDQARGLLLASLVHDIGHYPFAHVLEQYVASRFPDSHEAKAAVSHEKYTLALLDGDPDLSRAIKEHWGDDAKIEALRILEGNVPVLSQLLDGPIDLDKIDYLARDAAHCGVAYGSGLDADGLLKAMRCVENSSRLAL